MVITVPPKEKQACKIIVINCNTNYNKKIKTKL